MTTTPADLALESGLSQKTVRAAIRQLFGKLPNGETVWLLDDERAALVRERLDGKGGGELVWSLEVGDAQRRRAIHKTYGGQQQGGISTPTRISDILIFTSHASGADYGYDQFDGLREDGSFWYTGEGQAGDQTFVRGNRAIRDSEQNEKAIRIFATEGPIATYVGSFTTGDPIYRYETIPDSNGDLRQGIVFNLVPLDADESLLPVVQDVRAQSQAQDTEWIMPDFSDFVVSQDERTDPKDRVVSRVEFRLQADFGGWLREQLLEPRNLPLQSGATTIHPDFYVPAKGWIVEAKRSSGRQYVRTAIGQVLDYAHAAKRHGITSRPMVLLPGRPQPDLVGLLKELNILLAYRDADGFTVEESD